MTDALEFPPTILNHVSVGTNDYASARDFYDQVMAALGAQRLFEHPGAAAYGRQFPEFWLQTPINGKPATVGNGCHVGFFAYNKAQVDAFYAAALAAGGNDDGAPGPRPDYGPEYYGCFVRDLDGNKIEATFWDMSVSKS
ncbi:MAG: VOC family protein [Rhodospirillaceae bacterium]|nr:VOC family protein [Rhodospirillaceae bacterium]